MRSTLLVALVVLMAPLSACVSKSTAEIQSTKPLAALNLRGAPEAIANCIMNRLSAADRDQSFTLHRQADGLHIVAQMAIAQNMEDQFIFYDVSVSGSGTASHVELRAMKNIYGNGVQPDKTLANIEGCDGDQPRVR